jgi:hypothetical protein
MTYTIIPNLSDELIPALKSELNVTGQSNVSRQSTRIPLIIILFGCPTVQKYKDQIMSVEQTWGKLARSLNIPYFFFFGEEKTDLTDKHYIYLPNVKNDYHSATYKQYQGLKWVCDRYNPDFVFICGTDTYPNLPKLYTLLKQFNPNQSMYIGGHGDTRKISNYECYFHSGGCGLILSNKLLFDLYDDYDRIPDNWDRFCEKYNSNLIDACDVSLAFYIHCLNSKIVQVDGFYHCNHKGDPCCRKKFTYDKIISCHSMTKNDFIEFTNICKKNNYFLNYTNSNSLVKFLLMLLVIVFIVFILYLLKQRFFGRYLNN